MKVNIPELQFLTRDDFRAWLTEHATTSDGVWLVVGINAIRQAPIFLTIL
jgi:uncharacterized protein YdeI (YjbR/CyaY-like superfamily)